MMVNKKDCKILKKLLFFCLLTIVITGQAQKTTLLTDEITLEEVLKIASKNSLDAFKAARKHEYSYWEHKAYKASLLPKMTFKTSPFTYNRSVVERYDSNLNQDVFRPIQSLNSQAGLSLSQNIMQTGGTISLNSTYSQLVNYNETTTKLYNFNPLNISLYQPLMAYNNFKWTKRTAPLEYEKAKKELVYELQSINVKTVRYFFNWALATKKEEMAKEKVVSSKKLFVIGQKRYQIGSIEKEDLLNLELQLYNAEIEVTIQEKYLEQVISDLKIFLRDDLSNYSRPVLPELISSLKIDMDQSIKLFVKNNPSILNLEIATIIAERDLDKAIKGNRFDLSLRASFGLIKQSESFTDVYQDLLEQQMIAVNFSIPILDWGERKGNIKKARMNKEVQEIDMFQEKSLLFQAIKSKIRDFNLQERLVLSSLRANEISRESYAITEQRFLEGSVDLLKLTSSLNAWQASNESYMSKLSNYWRYYYEIQQYTLYNFRESRELTVDFDKGILK